jgi:hypothetical protein
VGNNPTGISPMGICYYQRNDDAQFKIGVYCESALIGSYKPTGIWKGRDNATVLMMDDARAPWAGGYVHEDGPVAVGEGASGGTLIRYLGRTHILYPGDEECRWPRVAVNNGRAAIISWGSRGMRLWCGELAEIAALPLADGSPVDPPLPPVEPPVPTTPNHQPTVVAVRSKYGKPLGTENAYKVSNEVAWMHRTEGFGLRRKTSGNNYNGFATDIVFHKPTNMLVDILGDSENAGNPQWNEVGPGNPDEWVAPTGPTPPNPPDPPVPPTDLEARVLALEEDLLRLREAMTGWIIK